MFENIAKKECIQILRNNYIGHIGFISNNTPFIIPITYYYDENENIIISYSGGGHKIDSMRLNNTVSFQVEDIKSLTNWKSVLLIGEFEELSGSIAKMHLHHFAQNVKNIMSEKEAIDPHQITSFSSKIDSGSIPIVYRIKINDVFGKQKSM